MNEPPKYRFRPQFQLLTAVCMALASGVILGVELLPLGWFLREAWRNAPEVIGYVIASDLLLVASVGYMFEFMLRRREARRQ